MESQLIDLAISINDLNRINNAILYDINMKSDGKLEKERSNCISSIDIQCKNIKTHLTDQTRIQFIDLIKKYLTIQEDYRNTKKDLFTMQLLMRNPNLTKSEIDMIVSGRTDSNSNILCRIKSVSNV